MASSLDLLRNPTAYVLLLVAATLMAVGATTMRRVTQMDGAFIQLSRPGTEGLGQYELGDPRGAARAYRAHFRMELITRGTTGDPIADALLGGDRVAARAAAARAHEQDPTAVDPPLILGVLALEEEALDEALRYLEHARRSSSRDPGLALLTAVTHTWAGDDVTASHLLGLDPQDSRGPSHLVSLLLALQTTGELNKRPLEDRPLCLLSFYYRHLGSYDAANEDRADKVARLAAEVAAKHRAVGSRRECHPRPHKA